LRARGDDDVVDRARRVAYLELNPDANGEDYVGGIYGASNAYGNYSHVVLQ
jgi:hypothetical protein